MAGKVQGLSLKSALWVTRGGAFRDLAHLESPLNYIHLKEAEECASDNTIDDEIKRIVQTTRDKNKLREVVEYLLKKDQIRYGWASQ